MVEAGGGHPEITFRTDYLLGAICARLGALLAYHGAPDPVIDPPPLSLDYLDELYQFAVAKAREIRKAVHPSDGG